MTIGEKIHEIRKKQNKTLKYISNETGVSIAFLSQLETNKCSATMASLRKIADALEIHPSYFFHTTTVEKEVADSLEPTKLFTYQNLSNGVPGAFTPIRVILQPGASQDDTSQHDGVEFIYCIEGTLTLTIGAKRLDLEPGASFMFDASEPHYWYNYTNQPVEFLVVNEIHKH
ncbi:helix-turn-helix domain-containing protein [Macrococcoides caseolyticum]|uniref:helix-turn-helix domain-containing protein n=1 Tax=Macrococcoides caseolyticum TaxID=69966 RepID=UPI001F414E07|nr:XRE family transcriptional regulator [Macrococcus caseolyticus]MCE4957512.1 helix-turn-helix transcriptional regulator [Macrococcus caseolyticus]